jgi:Zn-dependent protease
VKAGSSARIDPTELRGMAIGAPAGLVLGGALGALWSGNSAMRMGLQGTQAMDRALLSGGAMGALTGIALGVVGGFLVGHVQDEGWTMPGS